MHAQGLYIQNVHERLVLASASPRRRELLAMVGLSPECIPAAIDEKAFHAEDPEALVLEIASAKGAEISCRTENRLAWILAADTVVVAGPDQVLGKPTGYDDCVRMLRLLSGQIHRVLSAISLHHFSHALSEQLLVSTEVQFKQLSDEEIHCYASSPEPYDKAGGYGVQGVASAFVERITGSYTGVVGLPLVETLDLLMKYGIAYCAPCKEVGDRKSIDGNSKDE